MSDVDALLDKACRAVNTHRVQQEVAMAVKTLAEAVREFQKQQGTGESK